jgi:hypothetical protein
VAGKQRLHEGRAASLLCEQQLRGCGPICLGEREGVLVGALPDHAGRGEQRVHGGSLTAATGVLHQCVSDRGEADSICLQHLGQRRALLGPTSTGLLRRG